MGRSEIKSKSKSERGSRSWGLKLVGLVGIVFGGRVCFGYAGREVGGDSAEVARIGVGDGADFEETADDGSF